MVLADDFLYVLEQPPSEAVAYYIQAYSISAAGLSYIDFTGTSSGTYAPIIVAMVANGGYLYLVTSRGGTSSTSNVYDIGYLDIVQVSGGSMAEISFNGTEITNNGFLNCSPQAVSLDPGSSQLLINCGPVDGSTISVSACIR